MTLPISICECCGKFNPLPEPTPVREMYEVLMANRGPCADPQCDYCQHPTLNAFVERTLAYYRQNNVTTFHGEDGLEYFTGLALAMVRDNIQYTVETLVLCATGELKYTDERLAQIKEALTRLEKRKAELVAQARERS